MEKYSIIKKIGDKLQGKLCYENIGYENIITAIGRIERDSVDFVKGKGAVNKKLIQHRRADLQDIIHDLYIRISVYKEIDTLMASLFRDKTE